MDSEASEGSPPLPSPTSCPAGKFVIISSAEDDLRSRTWTTCLVEGSGPPSFVSSQSMSTTPRGGIQAVEEDFLNYDHCNYLEQDLERSQI